MGRCTLALGQKHVPNVLHSRSPHNCQSLSGILWEFVESSSKACRTMIGLSRKKNKEAADPCRNHLGSDQRWIVLHFKGMFHVHMISIEIQLSRKGEASAHIKRRDIPRILGLRPVPCRGRPPASLQTVLSQQATWKPFLLFEKAYLGYPAQPPCPPPPGDRNHVNRPPQKKRRRKTSSQGFQANPWNQVLGEVVL